jgi:hypothetical protein
MLFAGRAQNMTLSHDNRILHDPSRTGTERDHMKYNKSVSEWTFSIPICAFAAAALRQAW